MQFITDLGPLEFSPTTLVIAGWTGRNAAAVQHHIDELAAIGVAPPSKVPLFYRVSNTLITQEKNIDVLGQSTSGEAEPMVLRQGGKIWLGLGSDHTDRQLETTSVAASKQICQKPCAAHLWELGELGDHLDQIKIQSWIWENGDWQLYQDGTLAQVLPLDQLIQAADIAENSAMFCGTFPAIGGVRSAARFKATMTDTNRDRAISFEYAITPLPVVA